MKEHRPNERVSLSRTNNTEDLNTSNCARIVAALKTYLHYWLLFSTILKHISIPLTSRHYMQIAQVRGKLPLYSSIARNRKTLSSPYSTELRLRAIRVVNSRTCDTNGWGWNSMHSSIPARWSWYSAGCGVRMLTSGQCPERGSCWFACWCGLCCQHL